jgi:hypothetical protein
MGTLYAFSVSRLVKRGATVQETAMALGDEIDEIFRREVKSSRVRNRLSRSAVVLLSRPSLAAERRPQ